MSRECYDSVILCQSIISSVAEQLIRAVEAVTGGMLSMTIIAGSLTRIISISVIVVPIIRSVAGLLISGLMLMVT